MRSPETRLCSSIVRATQKHEKMNTTPAYKQLFSNILVLTCLGMGLLIHSVSFAQALDPDYDPYEHHEEKTDSIDTKTEENLPVFNKPVDELTVLGLAVIDGDTLPFYTFDAIEITARSFKSPQEEFEYKKLQRRVVKVYPYAQEAIRLMDEIEDITASIEKRRTRKKYLNKLEDQLKDQFKNELMRLSTKEGKVLVKMIERSTGETFYKTLKDLRNPVTAFFFQQVGKRYGYDLKEGYDVEKYGNLEEILTNIENLGLDFVDIRYETPESLSQFKGLPSVEETVRRKKNKEK